MYSVSLCVSPLGFEGTLAPLRFRHLGIDGAPFGLGTLAVATEDADADEIRNPKTMNAIFTGTAFVQHRTCNLQELAAISGPSLCMSCTVIKTLLWRWRMLGEM